MSSQYLLIYSLSLIYDLVYFYDGGSFYILVQIVKC